jgi:hypothetical protein
MLSYVGLVLVADGLDLTKRALKENTNGLERLNLNTQINLQLTKYVWQRGFGIQSTSEYWTNHVLKWSKSEWWGVVIVGA